MGTSSEPTSVAEALDRLSDEEWMQLHKVAAYYAGYTWMTKDDLLQEVIVRALEGTRQCFGKKGVVQSLAAGVASLANQDYNSKHSRRMRNAVQIEEAVEVGDAWHVDGNDDPEDVVVKDQLIEVRIRDVRALFKGDEEALFVIDGLLQDLSAQEVKEMCGLEETQYSTIRTRIRRKIRAHFPGGMFS